MFSSTAYEALYTYIGIYLHEASIRIITSQHILLGVLVIIFGVLFLLTSWRFVARYLPGVMGRSKGNGVFSFIKIIACFVIGVALLKVDSQTRVRSFQNVSWHTNHYIETKFSDLEEHYQVSFIFDILSRSAEELSRFASVVVDKLFKSTNSQIEAPSIFYRAIMYSGSLTIEDPLLRDKIDFYVHECFEKVLPLISTGYKNDRIDEFFKSNGTVDMELAQIPIKTEGGEKLSCLDLKNEVRKHLEYYAEQKRNEMGDYLSKLSGRVLTDRVEKNKIMSDSLVNYFLSQHEDILGIHKGAKVKGTASRIFQYFDRITSWDGILSLFGGKKYVGSALTAKRAQKFSEYLQRAPHIKGVTKMVLIFLFPWLVFFVIAGRWKILIYWFAVYASVLLWTPIWTLFYHIMTNIALSTDTLVAFGQLSDGISLYSAQLITSKLYHFYAVYSWLQILVGPLPTIFLSYGLFNSLLKDSEQENAPELVNEAKNVGKAVVTKVV